MKQILCIFFLIGFFYNCNGETGPKIINGTEAVMNNTKHQVSLRLKRNDHYFGGGHFCGGSVIAPTIVLTAAHCVYNYETMDGTFKPASTIIVAMGILNRYDFDNENLLTFNVTHFKILNTFNLSTYQDDIAILFLDGTIPSNHPTVEPIKLSDTDVADNTICQVTGWGYTENSTQAENLMTVDVPIINRATCSINYQNFIIDGMICAGYMEGEKDACQGDSGGPLVCNGVLAGIVSFGNECALPGYPGVYTDIKYFSNWIKSVTGGSSRLTISSLVILASILLSIKVF